FLIYSLLATTINEGIAVNFNLRGRKLEHAIRRMLDDGFHTEHTFWSVCKDLIKSVLVRLKKILFYFRFSCPTPKDPKQMSFVELFYNEPLIKYLGENKISKRPSYISPDFFSKAVLKILFDKGKSPEITACLEGLTDAEKFLHIKNGAASLTEINETRTLLLTMLDNSNNDIEIFKSKLENWFDETMHRASGWYKKQSQLITLLIGFSIAVVFNVNTIKLVQQLSRDKEAAKKMTELSVQYVDSHKDSTGHLSEKHEAIANSFFLRADSLIKSDFKSANQIIGIGWDYSDSLKKFCNKKIKNHEKCIQPCVLKKVPIKTNSQKVEFIFSNFNFRTIVGYIITAIAISFGAPFWFDLLSKFVSIRGAGAKPTTKKT
ncbi:MAG: hypothetical protein ACK48V_05425, partial [Crocinitomicaceae bacterium]